MDIEHGDSIRTEQGPSRDGSFLCLAMAARLLGSSADHAQLVRAWPPGPYPELTLLRAAKSLGLKARRTQGTKDRLEGLPTMGIALMDDGAHVLVIKTMPGKVLIYDPRDGKGDGTVADRPSLVDAAEFKEAWSGEIIPILPIRRRLVHPALRPQLMP